MEIEESVVNKLRSIVGEKNVSLAMAVREQHGRDESYHECMPPGTVVWPTCTEQVSDVVRVCSEYGLPMVPFGSGTGLEGGVNALQASQNQTGQTNRQTGRQVDSWTFVRQTERETDR